MYKVICTIIYKFDGPQEKVFEAETLAAAEWTEHVVRETFKNVSTRIEKVEDEKKAA